MQLWPWVTKVCCKYAAASPLAGAQPPSIVPAWAVHPSLKTALDSLQSYDCWVARVVMPIAFQWIEEHKDEVYKLVPTKPKDLTDDIGVVIAAAFTLVEQTPCYKEERSLWHTLYEQQHARELVAPLCLATGAEVNPIWRDIAEDIQEAIRKAFLKHKKVLRDTTGHHPVESGD